MIFLRMSFPDPSGGCLMNPEMGAKCFHGGPINTLRLRRNEQHFADDIFKHIFFIENVWISIEISLNFVPKGPINNTPALVQIMAWRRSGDRPLSEWMMVSLPTHICVTRPQWVNKTWEVYEKCIKIWHITLAYWNEWFEWCSNKLYVTKR